MNGISKQLIAAITALGKTDAERGKKLNVTARAVWNWRHNKRSLRIVERLIQAGILKVVDSNES